MTYILLDLICIVKNSTYDIVHIAGERRAAEAVQAGVLRSQDFRHALLAEPLHNPKPNNPNVRILNWKILKHAIPNGRHPLPMFVPDLAVFLAGFLRGQ